MKTLHTQKHWRTLRSIWLSITAPNGIFAAWWNSKEGWSIEEAAKGKLQWACRRCVKSGRAIEAIPVAQKFCDYPPYLAYFDVPLRCEDCGSKFVFEASEQRFWYEELKFWVQSRPKQCAACRKIRRDRKREQNDKRDAG